MASNITAKTRRDMGMQGWGISETSGDLHDIPMYLHLDKKNDKVFGDKFMTIRVGDPRNFPKNLNNSEMDLMNRKMRQIGVMPWLPGADCLKRKFVPYADVVNDRGETVPRYGTPTMGCKPCRVRAANEVSGLTAETTETTESLDSTITDAEPAEVVEVVQPETTRCTICDFEVKLTRKTGRGDVKDSTPKQRANDLRIHNKKHSDVRTVVNPAVPA